MADDFDLSDLGTPEASTATLDDLAVPGSRAIQAPRLDLADLGTEDNSPIRFGAPRPPLDIRDTTRGRPPVSLPEGAFQSTLQEIAGAAAETLGGAPANTGRAFKVAGDVALGGLGDLGAVIADYPAAGGNIKQALTDETGKPLPIETALKDAALNAQETGGSAAPAILGNIAASVARTAPKIAAMGIAGPSIVGQSIIAGGLFGLDDEGNFHPKEAVIAALLPGVGKLARMGVASALGNLVEGGAQWAANPLAQKAVEALGEQATLNAYMTATSAPELVQLYQNDPAEFKAKLAEIVGSNLAFGLLGLRKFGKDVPSETQEWIKAKSEVMAANAITHKIVEEYPPDLLKAIYGRVASNDPSTTAQEQSLVRFINEALAEKKGTALQKGALVTTVTRDMSQLSKFWSDYLGLKSGTERTVEVPGEAFKPGGRQYIPGSRLLTEKATDATNTEQQQGGSGAEYPGVNEVRKEEAGPSDRNSPKSPAGQPPEGQATGQQPTVPAPEPLKADMASARRIAAMTPDEFHAQAQGFNKINIDLGYHATDKDLEELKALRDQTNARLVEARDKANATGTIDDVNAFAKLSTMPQFYNEAIATAEAVRTAKSEQAKDLSAPAPTLPAPAPAPAKTKPQVLRELIMSDENGQQKALKIRKMAEDEGVSIKDKQEEVEFEIVQMADEIAKDTNISGREAYDKLIKLYERQPTMSARTSTSIDNQAYSTPAPLAFLTGFVTGVDSTKSVYDATGGNGMLLIGGNHQTSLANEMNTVRAANLRKLLPPANVTTKDATKFTPATKVDVVNLNPPFGTMESGVNYNGYAIKKLEHLIALKALEAMKDNGTASLILGAKREVGETGKGAQWVFENYLYGNYHVVANFEVSGDLYAKQGAKWPVRVLVIAGRKKVPEVGEFAPQQVPRLDDWEQLWVQGVRTHGDLMQQQARNTQEALAPKGDKKPDKGPRGAGDLDTLSDEELDAMLDDATGEKPAPKPPRKPPSPGPKTRPPSRPPSGPPKTPPASAPTKTAADIIAEAGKLGVQGVDDSLKGLTDLFGGGATLGTGPAFDEKTYAKAKPHFKSAYENFKNAGKTLAEFFKFIIDKFSAAIKPYLRRFIQDEKAGLNKEEVVIPPPSAPPEQPTTHTPPKIEGTEYQDVTPVESKGIAFGTLMPKNISAGYRTALSTLKANVGDVDNYVSGLLNMDVAQLHKSMAAEQIDSVALMLFQVINGGAAINGSETGIGKGRTAAAVMRYAMLNGMIPVFFTKDPKLFTDMHGDLAALGTTLKPFLLGNEAKAGIVDNQGSVIVNAPDLKAQGKIMQGIVSKGIEQSGYNAIFLTYSQVNVQNARQAFLENLAEKQNVMVVLDEAHEAAGDTETSMQAAFITGGIVKRKDGPATITIPVKGLLNAEGTKQDRGGVVYLSATYAKRSDNMPVYFRTSLGKADPSFQNIVNAMVRGGTALQQAVSEALAKAGQYFRMERDFTGTRYEMVISKDVDKDKLIDHVDQVTDVLAEIIRFSTALSDAVNEQSSIRSTAMSQNQIDMASFASVVHNQVSQLLLAAKAEAVVKKALEAHKNGEKPMVVVYNTMESFLENYVEDKGLKDGRKFQLRWNELLKYALSRSLRAKNKLPDGSTEIVIIDPDAYGMKFLYNAIVKLADGIESNFPTQPLDYILQKLREGGVTMAEMTGRGSQFVYTDFEKNEGYWTAKKPAKKNEIVSGFNNGKYDGMLLNSSGSTGLSAHAGAVIGGVRTTDHRPRHMIIGQAAPDINVFMQTLGRPRRTGMLSTGTYADTGEKYGARYTHLVLPLQAEVRPATMAARKMKSLNANTTSETDSNIKIQAEDIFNKYGDLIVTEYLDANQDLQGLVGIAVEVRDDGSLKVTPDVARKFTGRMAVLPDADQETAYEAIIPAYREFLDQLKATGEYDLEIVVHDDWDGVRRTDDQLAPGTDEDNIFTASVRMQRWNITDNRHIPTGNEMLAELQKTSGGRAGMATLWENYKRKVAEDFQKRRAAINEKKNSPHEGERHQADADLIRLTEAEERWNKTTEAAIHAIVRTAGDVVEVINNDTGETYEGMLVQVNFPKGRRPAASAFRFKFLLHSPGGIAWINGSQFGPTMWQVDPSDKTPNDLEGGRSEGRVERFFVTGNPIGGYVATGGRGKVVRFKSHEGQVVTGLLMPANWGPEQLAEDPRLDLINGKAAEHFLRDYGTKAFSVVPIELGSGLVRIARRDAQSSNSYRITTPAAARTAGNIYLDAELRALTGDFEKQGQRMNVLFPATHLGKVIDRIMAITKKRFRPVGKTEELMPLVDRANERGRRQGAVEPAQQTPTMRQETLRAQTATDLRRMLPSSGMPAEHKALITALLDSPLGEHLEGLNYVIADSLMGNWQGSYIDGVVELTRTADPLVGPEEMLHHIWEVLPDDIQKEFERLRVASIEALLKEPRNAAEIAALEDLRDNPSVEGRDFLSRLYPRGIWKTIYPYASATEFFAQSGSKQFKEKVGSIKEGFWARVKEFIRNFIAAIKKALHLDQTQEQWLRNILEGNFEVRPENAIDESRRQASLTPAPEGAEEEPTEPSVPTQVFGETDYVRNREQVTPSSTQASIDYAKRIFDKARVPVTLLPNSKGGAVWVIQPTGFDMDIEGQLLLKSLKTAIASQQTSGKGGDHMGSLLNTIVYNYGEGTLSDFSRPLREDLYDIAQADRSQKGMALGALAMHRPEREFMGKNVDVVLHRTYSDMYGGPAIRSVVERIMEGMREWFTDEEIREVIKEDPTFLNAGEKMINLNRLQSAGRVYRRVQSLLKPKRKKTLAMLEADAKVEEAVNQLIENAKLLGIEPPPNPNKKLSALKTLLLMVRPETAEKMDAMIATAVATGEREAGIAAAIKAAGSPQEQSDIKDRFSAGEEPTADQVEDGLDMPQYAHWRALRDDLLNYSPTTVKLAQALIRQDFKGTRFGKPIEKPADTRLDLEKLAKEGEPEVKRVLDAFVENIEGNMDLAGATDETHERVRTMVQREVEDQLEKARIRFRGQMFKEPVPPGAKLTAEQQMAQMIHAGLFRDERMDIPDLVDRVASKSRVKRLTPTLTSLIKDIFETPFYRQDELRQRFVDGLVRRLAIPEEQAEAAGATFMKAFQTKLAEARTKAIAAAKASMTREEVQVFKQRPLWKKMERIFNATGGISAGDVLREIVRSRGGVAPTDAQVNQMRDLTEQEQRLRDLTPSEIADAGGDPVRLARARSDREAATIERRALLVKQIGAIWARFTRPVSLRHPIATRQNLAAAMNEFEVADMLLKVGFVFRLPTHIMTQLFLHVPTRALGYAFARHETAKAKAQPTMLWRDISSALSDGYSQTIAAVRPALRSAQAAWSGRSEARNVDRLMTGIAMFDRIELKAKELDEKGQHSKAALLKLMGLIKFSLRYVQAVDNFQGVPSEYADLAHQARSYLRENGRSPAEIEVTMHSLFANLSAKRTDALAEVRRIMAESRQNVGEREMMQTAWEMVKSRIYQQMREIGMPADDFRGRNEVLRRTVAWQEKTVHGPGALPVAAGKILTQLVGYAGLPFSFTRFANAIGTGINYSLMNTPLYAFASVRIPGISGREESSWFRTREDIYQRRAQATVGSIYGALVMGLVLSGVATVRLMWPRNKAERELWEAQGHRPGTIEFNHGDGTFTPMSLTVGPLQPVAPYAAAAGALMDKLAEREKAQAALNAQAEKTGMPAGKIKPLTYGDLAGVAAAAAGGAIIGNKGLTGVASSVSDFGHFNVVKMTAAYVSPLVPGLPAWQEASRMMGVTLDAKLASFWDYMVPVPGTKAQAINMLGDPVGTQDDVQRVIQNIMAGSYPGTVDPNAAKQVSAYNALMESGFRPPSVDPNKGYAIGGEVRPMNETELDQYTVARAQNLRSELQVVDPGDRKAVASAYQRANQAALASVGASAPSTSGGSAAGGTSTKPSAGAGTAPAGTMFGGGGTPSRAPRARTGRRGSSLRGMAHMGSPMPSRGGALRLTSRGRGGMRLPGGKRQGSSRPRMARR